ncbi:condensation domain-containing protein, partial [Luteibacter sp. PPL201]
MEPAERIERLKRAALLKRLQESKAGKRADLADADIVRVDRSRRLPLSWAQKRLYFIHRLDAAASVAYHMPAGLRLRGALEVSALRRALNWIVARHEVLRTTFSEHDGEPCQRIGPATGEIAWTEHDLGNLPASEREARIAAIGEEEASAAFDLAHGPLIRAQLLHLSDDEHVLYLTQHHIVSDQWSIGVLVREFGEAYTAFANGTEPAVAPLVLQYADYAAWQQSWLQGEALQTQIAFWRRELEGAPQVLTLPTDRPRPAVQSYAGGTEAMYIPSSICAGLRDLAQRHGTTLYMTLLTGLSILLSRLSGQDDVVIGSPFANRRRPELEPLLGFFANTLAMRLRVVRHMRVDELLAQARRVALDAFAHHEVPFEQVVDALNPDRNLGYNPVFQVALGLNNMPGNMQLSLPGLALSSAAPKRGTAAFDLCFTLVERDEGIEGEIDYSSDLFDRTTIRRMVGQWLLVLQAMVHDDTQTVSALPLLDDAERRHVLEGFNATERSFPHEGRVHELFEAQARHTPDALAMRTAECEWSYARLDRIANQWAHRIRDRFQVRPDTRIALVGERSAQMVIGMLAVLKAGGAYVPLDPDQPAERLAFQLRDSGALAALVQGDLVPVVREVMTQERVLSWEESADAWPAHAPLLGASEPTSRSLAYVMYTSG